MSVPTLKNWILTLKCYMRLWEFFRARNVKIMRPRYFNSDPIQIFLVKYGRIISEIPTQLVTLLRPLLNDFWSQDLSHFTQRISIVRRILLNNCLKLKTNLGLKVPKQVPAHPPIIRRVVNRSRLELTTEGIGVQVRREKFNVQSRAYTAGWVVRNYKKSKLR